MIGVKVDALLKKKIEKIVIGEKSTDNSLISIRYCGVKLSLFFFFLKKNNNSTLVVYYHALNFMRICTGLDSVVE
jgi:hypothetical protein